MRFIRSKARKLAQKYEVDAQEIEQDYFLDLLMGHNSFIENTAMETIRKEYRRGFVGSRKISAPIVDIDELKVKAAKNDNTFFEYLWDTKRICSEEEYRVICFALMGFGCIEAWRQTKDMKRRDFTEAWKKFELVRIR